MIAMQEKRNLQLAISLGVLLSAIAVLAVWQGNKQASVDKNLFRVADLKSVNRVALQSASDSVVLAFTGNRWRVNNSEIADRDLVDVLFATLLQAEPRRPVGEGEQDSISKMLEAEGIRVTLYDEDNVQLQFIAGGNRTKTQAYYKAADGNVYVVNIPGYKVYASGIFELKEVAWFDKYVFAFNWTNFKKLETAFPAPSRNFKVARQNDVFAIERLPTDTAKLNTFLDAVSLLTVDQYMTDSIDAPILMQMTVTDIANREYRLAVSTLQQNGSTACRVRQNTWAWVDNRKLAPLLMPRDFYTKKP
jgi:hypothetical protein